MHTKADLRDMISSKITNSIAGPVKWLSYVGLVHDALQEITKSGKPDHNSLALKNPFYKNGDSPSFYFSKYFSRPNMG